jgi:hypothetical protein
MRSLLFLSLLALASGCSAAPPLPEGPPVDAASHPDDAGAPADPDATTLPDAADAAPATCAQTLDAFCEAGPCPASTWAETRSTAIDWCSKPYGVILPYVTVSASACAGASVLDWGDGYGGEMFIYDAASGALVAVYDYDDTNAFACLAGTPVDSAVSRCGGTYLCEGPEQPAPLGGQ